MNDCSTLTNREFFRLHGTLTEARMEALMDDVDAAIDPDDVVPYVEEARVYFPKEDFLASVIDDLRGLAKRLRGGNRQEADRLVDALDALAQEQVQSTEFGLDELRKALKELGAEKPNEKKK